jgi:magnesium transporter
MTTSSPPSRSETSLQPDAARILAVRDGRSSELSDLDAIPAALASEDCRVWIDLTSPTSETLARVSEILDLHPLIVEDILERNQRAKFEEVGGVIHLVIFALQFAGEVHAAEIDIVLAERFLLTAHDPDWDPYQAPQIRQGPGNALARGPDYLFYTLGDWIVDGYFPVLDRLADDIDQLQDDVVERASQWTLQRLFGLKRELISMRRATSPAREIFNQLTNRRLTILRPEHGVYFRDVYDHLIRVTDELDNYRELVSGTLDVYLSTVNNNLSLIMKRLTGVTVILAGIGAVAGIFGMSEAGAAFTGAEASGFWLISALTVGVAVVAAVVLRRFDWI